MTFLSSVASMNEDKMDGYENIEICRKCGGKCCKSLPGCAWPDDFGLPDTTRLVEALRSGRWAIDWWEGDPHDKDEERDRAYYIRPATKKAIGKLLHPSWGNEECTFLTPMGCQLPFEKRPRECRLMEPKEEAEGKRPCVNHSGSKRQAAIAWLQYEDELRQIIQEWPDD